MTAILQTPFDALNTQFDKLATSVTSSLSYSSEAQYNKVKLDEEAKKKKIFETSYEPSPEWWARNQAEFKAPENDPLPVGFPEKSVSESVWDGKVLINQQHAASGSSLIAAEKWLYRFTPDDIVEIETAYTHFESLDLPFNAINHTTFPIPTGSGLFRALKDAEQKVKYGLGLTVLRGLPVREWERTKQIAIFAGVSSYIGAQRIKQGKQNIVHLRDITNLDVDKRPAITVKGQTSGNQVFHNDGTIGIIGLITLGVAETGGLSQLSSVGQTYNELASTRRDILRELAKDDWKNKMFPEGKALIFPVGQQVVSSYSRRPFFGFYEAESDFPPLPTEKHLALDAIHFTAEKFSLDLELQVGDLEYANNLTVFHARTSSEDSETNQRHLVRVHLEHKDQPLPADVREVFDKINAGEADEWPQEAWDSVDRSGIPKSHLK